MGRAPLAGVIAGAQAAVTGIAAVFGALITVWLVASHGDDSAFSVLRASGPVWLSTHMVPLTLGAAPLSLLPLLALALPMWLVRRAYKSAVRSCSPKDPYEYVQVAGFLTATYATLGVAVSAVLRSPDLYADSGRALVQTAAVAALATLPLRMPATVRRATAVAVGLLAAGALLVTVSLAMHVPQVAALTGAMAPGFVNSVALTALCVGYIPNASVWAVSYLLGPGVVIGAAHPVSVFEAAPGRVPAFPLLAMVPTSVPHLAVLVMVVPALAGAVLFVVTPRTWRDSALAVGTVVALVTTAAWLSAGSLGGDQLAVVGPEWAKVAVAALKVIGGGFAVTSVVPRVLLMLLRSRRP